MLHILLSSGAFNCLYLPLPGNTGALPVTLSSSKQKRSESGCFPSHPVCSHLSCLPLISLHLHPVMFCSRPCLTAACFPLGQVFFDAWPQHQSSPPVSDRMATQIELELRCLFELKWGICYDSQGLKPVTLTLEDRKETAKSKSLSESDMGRIVMAG